MIFHNRYLAITNIEEMGQYTFDNLKGYEKFSQQVKKGDIIVTGKNFGCGSSRQQAVDCFKSLGVSLIIAESFGAIYERNAINNSMPIMAVENITKKIDDKDDIVVDFISGEITNSTQKKSIQGKSFSKVQLEILKKGGLLEV
jgi:3-isopropylmalate dehydratase small subunit